MPRMTGRIGKKISVNSNQKQYHTRLGRQGENACLVGVMQILRMRNPIWGVVLPGVRRRSTDCAGL